MLLRDSAIIARVGQSVGQSSYTHVLIVAFRVGILLTHPVIVSRNRILSQETVFWGTVSDMIVSNMGNLERNSGIIECESRESQEICDLNVNWLRSRL